MARSKGIHMVGFCGYSSCLHYRQLVPCPPAPSPLPSCEAPSQVERPGRTHGGREEPQPGAGGRASFLSSFCPSVHRRNDN